MLPIILGLSFVEFKLQNNENSYYALKSKCLKNNIANCRLIVFGSSTENTGIKPEIIDTLSLNLALIGGTGFDVFEKLLIEHLPEAKHLKNVIIPISSFSFFANDISAELKFRRVLLHKYLNIYKEEFKNPLNNIILSHLGLKKSVKQIFSPNKIQMTPTGFEINDEYHPELLCQEEGIKKVHQDIGSNIHLLNQADLFQNIKILKNIINILKQKGIKVHLITAPTHKYYYNNIDPEIINTINITAQSIANEFDIKYHNFINDERFVDKDFFNCDHLNHRGAVKFSEIIKKEVLSDQ